MEDVIANYNWKIAMGILEWSLHETGYGRRKRLIAMSYDFEVLQVCAFLQKSILFVCGIVRCNKKGLNYFMMSLLTVATEIVFGLFVVSPCSFSVFSATAYSIDKFSP